MQKVIIWAVSVTATFACALPNAPGELIVDDFDLDFVIDLRAASFYDSISDVKELEEPGFYGMERWISASFGRRTDLDTVSAINFETTGGVALATANTLSNTRGPSLTLRYMFSSRSGGRLPNGDYLLHDITEDGANDAIFIDFSVVDGPRPLLLQVELDTFPEFGLSGARYETFLDLAPFPGPLTLAIPFDDFEITPSNSFPVTDFRSTIRLGLILTIPETATDSEWSIGIDRIRFGQVPEPSTSRLVVAILLIALARCELSGRRPRA